MGDLLEQAASEIKMPVPGKKEVLPLVRMDIQHNIDMLSKYGTVASEHLIKLQTKVLEGVEKRIEMGRKKYGTPLMTNNGRPVLLDMFQEALDLVNYSRQFISELDEELDDKSVLRSDVYAKDIPPGMSAAIFVYEKALASALCICEMILSQEGKEGEPA